MAIECDIAIVGAGPGGYVAAIRAAQLGARVALVEREQIGGTCLNWGCVPSKALLECAEHLDAMGNAATFGISVDHYAFDWAKVQARKDNVVKTLRNGVAGLIRGNGVTYVTGTASFVSPRQLRVAKADGTSEDLTATKGVLIATGSVEARPPVPGMELPGIMTSKEAFQLTDFPESIAIMGGGYIGVEFATIFRAFGAKVTVIEMLPTLVPLEDAEIGRALATSYQKQGIAVKVGTKVNRIEQTANGYRLALSSEAGDESLSAQRVLVAAGRWPYTEGLGLDRIGAEMDRRTIKVDSRMRTSVAGVYAVGDVVGKYPLAHVASAQGELAIENMLGHGGGDQEMDYRGVPDCVFCHPQISAVGLTEEKARAAGYAVKVGRFPFVANSKAIAIGQTEGFVKIVSEEKYGQVLGVHIIGANATDLVGESLMAIDLETTVEDFVKAIHPHPTLTEALREAALDVDGRSIHVYRRKR